MEVGSGHAKRVLLEPYLHELPATRREVTLGFDQIEGIR